MIDWIVGVIEWFASDSAEAFATLFPFGLAGLVLLYAAWVVVGYMRVSRVEVTEGALVAGRAERLPRAPDGVLEVERGVPFCEHCGLRYPPGALFCARCEGDLVLDCANCGKRIRASDEACLRCGTRETTAAVQS
ncbi:MAG: zinc ribbon domain-containing protein [Candidatus Limnocylindria bacterium]